MTPFEALYGYAPTIPSLVDNGEILIEALDYTMQTRDQIGRMLKENLCKAHERMQMYADRKWIDKEFNCGDFVYLKIQPYKQHSLAKTSFHKLSARYMDPTKLLKELGKWHTDWIFQRTPEFIMHSCVPIEEVSWQPCRFTTTVHIQ